MTDRAILSRGMIVALVVSLLAGCTGSRYEPSATAWDELAQAEAERAAVESAAANPPPAQFTNMTTLADIAEGDIGVDLAKADGASQVIIRTSSGEPVFDVARLENPPRVVVDLLGVPNRVNRVLATENDPYIAQIRVGAHADKSRVVIDLNQNQASAHQVDVIDGQLVVTVGEAARVQEIASGGVSAGSTMARPNIDQTVKTEDHADGDEHGEHDDEHEGDADKHEGHVTPAAAPDRTVTTVRSLRFALDERGESMAVATVSSPTDFTITRSAPSEFVLRIPNAKLAEEIVPIVSPPAKGGLRSVRPMADETGVTLRIFAQPETQIAARLEGDQIVVVANRPGAPLDDARAQAANGAAEVTPSAAPAVADATATDAQVSAILADRPKYTGRLISLDLQDTDIDNALRIIAEVSNLNIIASEDVTGKVTLRLIDVPWDQALDVILKTNGLDKVQEGNVVRIAPVEKLRSERESLKSAQQAEEALEPLKVKYIRINYAKASELKALVESVLSERGSVAHDERSNQLIVKDIQKGIVHVAELVSKLDLRTPQVLLETQIVEANRTLFRDLGAELDFTYLQSPATGNATGENFPNSVAVGGGLPGGGASSFPAAVSALGGSAVAFLFGSADGTKSLDLRLSALEREGRVRIVSRPSVATINNKQAQIKSVEKIRIKLPDSGTTVGIGGGGTNVSGSSSTATEIVEVGIVLEMTPQASPDYYVLLDIDAKSSTLGSTFVDGIPSEIERAATSTVLVSSGQTFALGGIYKITDDDRMAGVPFLKDVPVFGHLFREQVVNNKDEELIFFITPRIVEGSFDDAAMKVVS